MLQTYICKDRQNNALYTRNCVKESLSKQMHQGQ